MVRRTTLTLDDDVARKLDEESRKRGEPLRAVVNEALRRGLNPAQRPAASSRRFRVRARKLGLRRGLDLDSAEQLLDAVDGASRK